MKKPIRCQWKILLLCLPLLNACGLGKESILFITKTSMGVDIDTKPPTIDIGYARKEGTLAPVLGEGEVLPQMASFTSNVGIINTAIGQSFAVGNAAKLMTKYFGTSLRPNVDADTLTEEVEQNSTIKGNLSHSKRYFFGTDTSFALRITFGLETGGYPDSFSLGYKRKELAYVPLGENNNETGLPSLLATATLQSSQPGFAEGEVRYTQFYATGTSANYLAAHPDIRNIMMERIDPEIAKRVRRFENFENNQTVQVASVKKIQQAYNTAQSEGRASIRREAQELRLVPEGTTDENFNKTLSRVVDGKNTQLTKNLKDLESIIESMN